jgi:16S rRNA processing protein RimM
VGRPHGLDGSFYVTRPLPRLLVEGTIVNVADGRARIVRRAGTDARPIVRLEGVSSREAVEVLRGQDLSVEGADVPPLGEGEWWAHELEACEVHADGRRVGNVVRMLKLPSCEALEVALADGGTLLVPMVKEAVLEVDPAARRIEIDLGFLGLEEKDRDKQR